MDEHKKNMTDLEAVRRAAYEGAKEGAKKNGFGGGKSFLVSIATKVLLVVIIVALVPVAISRLNPFTSLVSQFSRESDVSGHDLTLENNGIFGYTTADFEEAILGDASQLKKLEVYSQEVSDTTTITDAGLLKFKVFSKTQVIKYTGTATYTVDLSKITKDSIEVDDENKEVTLYIPHAELEPINITRDNIKYGEVKKGKLAFGKIEMTGEEFDKVEAEAVNKMEEKLKTDKVKKNAERFAQMSVWEIYQPLITGVASEYKLNVEFVKSK